MGHFGIPSIHLGIIKMSHSREYPKDIKVSKCPSIHFGIPSIHLYPIGSPHFCRRLDGKMVADWKVAVPDEMDLYPLVWLGKKRPSGKRWHSELENHHFSEVNQIYI
jgi:hypothetical protein